ncbi:hypothetical protein QMA61_11995 [Streptomyces coelicoflavus]|uniref:hypothetical protein n=1 Tax=Streptomyces coelicoflavus TaxID=285562 RepID=UPI0024AE34C3|nr:hypothetical protein [Streptomyces coelicoflavus]MDI6516919.1 hypothetical protein [Streptomyces coelicoflavus]
MSHEKHTASAVARESSLAHELHMALHALATDLMGPSVDRARIESRLRMVIGLGQRALDRRIPLPRRPFDFSDERRPIGPGALLFEYVGDGSTLPADLLGELDSELLTELDQLVTRAERVVADGGNVPRPAPVGGVPLLLAPVDDWYVIAGADIVLDPRDGALPPSPLPDSAAIDRGLHAARPLVVTVGRKLATKVRPRVDAPYVLSPSTVAPDSAPAAVALSWIAAEGGLPDLGTLGVLALAGISQDGDWMPPAVLEQAMGAAAEAGLDVLWRDTDGWRLHRAGVVESDTEATLLGAARLLWREQWHAAVRRRAAQILDEEEWRVLHASATGDSEPGWSGPADERLVDFERSSFLFKRYHQRPLSRVIQSGPRNSGKTVCARQVVRKLEAAGWQTVVLSPDSHQLPSDGDLLPVVRAALTSTGVDSTRQKVLVVLEDLHALEDGNIGEALESLGELKVGALALTRYVDGATNRWENHGVTAYVTLVPPEDVPDLARRMIRQAPGGYRVRADDTAAVALAVEACHGDLGLLADLLREEPADKLAAAGTLPDKGLGADRVRARAQSVCDALDAGARAAVYLLAAVSWLDDGVPTAHVQVIPEETRQALGVVVHHGTARIPSTVRAEALIAAASPGGLDAFPAQLEPYVLGLLRDDNQPRLDALLRKCAAYAPERLALLLKLASVRKAITDWAAKAHPRKALSVLRLCRRHSDADWIAAALPAVLHHLRSVDDLTARDLTLGLSALWDDEFRLSGTTELADLVAWVGTPGGGLNTVLGRPSSLTDRYHLVSALLKLAGEGTTPTATVCDWFEQHSDDLARDADPANHKDLIAVRRMDDLIFAKSQQARVDDPPSALRPLFKPAQLLIKAAPTKDRSLAAILSWMSLRLHFDGAGDWDQIIEQYKSQLQAALAHSDAIQISQALYDLAQSNRGLCNRLLNHLKFGRTLVPVVKAAPPAEAAILISTVRNIHGSTLRTLLYQENRDGDLIADIGLVRELAKSVRGFEDARGAGMLLSAVSRVDDLYCATKERFSYRLTMEIGQEFVENVMRRERRPAIVYHLLRGLWEAGADFRQDIEDGALGLVVSSIHTQRGTARPWGPRLAMLLIQDEYFGQSFLQKLAGRLDRKVLCDRMFQMGLDPESMVHTHRLGIALVPDIGVDYAKRLKLNQAVHIPLLSSASNVAQKLHVMANTLRAGGHVDGTGIVLRHFKEEHPQWDWAERLRVGRSIGAFTTTLGQLRTLQPGAAAMAVDDLSRPHAGQELSHLRELVLRSVVHPPLTAELLSEVERCVPGLGKSELEALRGGRRWTTLVEAFKFDQDPLTQGHVGRALARLGVINRTEETEWMHTLVTTRWESTMHFFASPRAVNEMLTLAHMWEPQWGEQLAASVNVNRLINRIRLALRSDLQEVPGLLRALWLTGGTDAFDAILGHVIGLPVDVLANALGLHQASKLLKVAKFADRPADSLAQAVGRLVEQVAGRHLVVDAEAHWTGIGWAAQALHECSGQHLLPAVVPALRPNTVAHPAAVAWASVWLPHSDWSVTTVAEAVDSYERSGAQHWYPQETCRVLIAAARAGLLPITGPLATHWHAATEASPELVTLLTREAAGSPVLRDHFASPRIAQRMWEVTGSGLSHHLCEAELRSAVKRLCPQPPASDSTSDVGLDL